MYEDLRIIYREYIQNAADSIDKAIAQKLITPEEARIDIEIDAKQRTISTNPVCCWLYVCETHQGLCERKRIPY